ncbi:hypothetical protein HYW72_00665 [Candidatus Nomurabacteria bacterium]|nr:hypothetical protein [Candidatus Nomurabacteria bacterium]
MSKSIRAMADNVCRETSAPTPPVQGGNVTRVCHKDNPKPQFFRREPELRWQKTGRGGYWCRPR